MIKPVLERLLLAFLFCALFNGLSIGQNSIDEDYYLLLYQTHHDLTYKPSLEEISSNEIIKLIYILEKHQRDSVFEKRWQGVILANKIGVGNYGKPVEQKAVSLLLGYMHDSDHRIVYMASQGLKEIDISYVSSQKDSLVFLMSYITNRNLLTDLYRISGIQQIEAAIPLLQEITMNRNNPFMQRWVALATLSRLGLSEAENEMNGYLERLPLNLDVIDGLYPYVVYSQSRRNVEFLINKILFDTSGCESTNPNVTYSIPCAYMVLRMVAPAIKELRWEDDLQNMPHDDALQVARNTLKTLQNNWNFEEK
jgi:hypothetical protein